MATKVISPSGNDSTGTGSEANPWLTMKKWIGDQGVDAAPQPGDILLCRGGTYTNQPVSYFGRHDSGVNTNNVLGTAQNPITVKNYPGEIPLWSGVSGVDPSLITISNGTWIVIDGIRITARPGTQSGWIILGQWPAGGPWGPADDIVIQNCRFMMGPGVGDNGYHPIYGTAGTHRPTVQNNVFIGPQNSTLGDGGFGCQFYEGSRDAPTGIIIRNNVFDGWNQGGCTIWGGTENPGPDGQILHNTFKGCLGNVRLGDNHLATVVRNNAGTSGVNYDLSDNVPGNTTADHNFWGQTFQADYSLANGQSGIGAASDGLDAGAIQRPRSSGARMRRLLLVRPG